MDDLDSYISPIHRIAESIQSSIEEREGEILMKAVHNVGFDVDKYELMRALAYDREQYKKGYADAMKNAVPLDKLCEYLNSVIYPCIVCKESPGPQCNAKRKGCWERVLTKWMEGLDAEVH